MIIPILCPFFSLEWFVKNIELSWTLALQIPAILAGLILVLGILKERSTLVAIFLWTILEVTLLNFIFFSYKACSGIITRHELVYDYVIICKYMIQNKSFFFLN